MCYTVYNETISFRTNFNKKLLLKPKRKNLGGFKPSKNFKEEMNMVTIQEMEGWNYEKAWGFFKMFAGKYIPELSLYVRSLEPCKTVDIREDSCARQRILDVINSKTLILIDGSSSSGKSTFANRLANKTGAKVIDIDIICMEWFDKQLKNKNQIEQMMLVLKMNELTDKFILENLEKIIEKESSNSVILVGAYLDVIYRTIIAKTLGKYFEKVVSIYLCAKDSEEVKMMHRQRCNQFGSDLVQAESKILEHYEYSKRLLVQNGIWLGFGMTASFIADISVSDMFIK